MDSETDIKTIITPESNLKFGRSLREIFSYRELLWQLTWRDFRIRYAQTFLGLLWALIQPLLTLLIFILVFNKAIQVNTGSVPYAVFAMTGMWAWSYFSYVLSQSGQSLIQSQALITKVYFPRLLIPLSKSLVGFIDFFVASLLLIVLMIGFHFLPSGNSYALPFFILMLVLFSLSLGIWFSALTIRFRDLQHTIPFIVQLGLYLTPIGYPSSLIPSAYKNLFYLNPMASIVDGFRWSLLGMPLPNPHFLWLSGAMILFLFIAGIWYFCRVESSMADFI
jgi:lipopolysaccharide transport system permease protein